jgi:DNA-directed RNA polymerase specialized sigma subunit
VDSLRTFDLERTVYLRILTNIITKVDKSNYIKLYYRWLTSSDPTACKRMSRVEKGLGISRPYLFYTYHNIQANLDLFLQFKSSILKQYINLTHKYASAHIKHKNKNLSYDDLFQNIVAAVSKALDKYDSSKGALTSYIKYWIINALNQDNSHGEGLAYEVSHTQRQKMATGKSNDVNFSMSLSDKENSIADDNTPETIAEKKSSSERLLRLMKAADIDGIFRLVNNIDECLNKEEILLMERHMRHELKLKKHRIKGKRNTRKKLSSAKLKAVK